MFKNIGEGISLTWPLQKISQGMVAMQSSTAHDHEIFPGDEVIVVGLVTFRRQCPPWQLASATTGCDGFQ